MPPGWALTTASTRAGDVDRGRRAPGRAPATGSCSATSTSTGCTRRRCGPSTVEHLDIPNDSPHRERAAGPVTGKSSRRRPLPLRRPRTVTRNGWATCRPTSAPMRRVPNVSHLFPPAGFEAARPPQRLRRLGDVVADRPPGVSTTPTGAPATRDIGRRSPAWFRFRPAPRPRARHPARMAAARPRRRTKSSCRTKASTWASRSSLRVTAASSFTPPTIRDSRRPTYSVLGAPGEGRRGARAARG